MTEPPTDENADLSTDTDVAFVRQSATSLIARVEHEDARLKDVLTRRRAEVMRDWRTMVAHLDQLVAELEERESEFPVQAVAFQLGFSASGRLGFIAEAGATASVTVTFAAPCTPVTD